MSVALSVLVTQKFNRVETVEDIGALYVEIAALLCDLTHDINTLDFSSTIKV